MKRKEYLKPEMKVFQLKSKSQLLTVSTVSRKTMQIYNVEVDDEEDIIL